MTEESKLKVESILTKCINGAIRRTQKSKVYRPFHEALLSETLVNASSFERSFSTSFGQGPIEEISAIVATDNGFVCLRQKETLVSVYKGAIDEIERIMSSLRSGQSTPNWSREVQRVISVDRGDTEVRRVIFDLMLTKPGQEIYISIKTVKPNLDQTEIAKKDMLMLKAYNPSLEVYLGLYYNPGGPLRSDYNWTMPMKIFNMRQDPCILIGQDYWDKLGGPGTYSELLLIFAKVGEITRKIILS